MNTLGILLLAAICLLFLYLAGIWLREFRRLGRSVRPNVHLRRYAIARAAQLLPPVAVIVVVPLIQPWLVWWLVMPVVAVAFAALLLIQWKARKLDARQNAAAPGL